MKILIYICACVIYFVVSISIAQEKIIGEGKVVTDKNTSPVFEKTELLFEAFKDIYLKKLQGLGLDSERFFKTLEDRFLEKNKETEVAKIKDERIKYYALNRAILSYSIDSISKSTADPNIKYIKIFAQIDEKNLISRYNSLLGINMAQESVIQLEVSVKKAALIRDLFCVIDELKSKAGIQKISATISEFKKEEGLLLINFSGTKSDIFKVILSLNGVVLKSGKTIQIADQENPQEITLL